MKKTAFMATFLGLAMSLSAAPFNGANVPAEAKFVAHLDADVMRGSQMGAFILKQMEDPKASAKIDAFSVMLGFDPRTDLEAITLYGVSERPEEAVLLAKGNFDTSKLAVLVKANDGYTSSTHNELVIHSWEDDQKGKKVRRYGFVLANGTVAMSDGKAAVEHLADVLSGKANSLAQLDAADKPSPLVGDGVLFSAAVDLTGFANLGRKAEMLKKARGGRMSIAEQNNQMVTNVQLDTTNAETSNQLHAMMQGMMAFAQLNTELDPNLTRLIQSVTTNVDGSTIEARVAIPMRDVLDHMEAEAKKKKL